MDDNKVIKIRTNHTPKEMIINEVNAMKYVKENTTIPVPSIIEYSEDYILMTREKGINIDEVWDELNTSEKEAIFKQLMFFMKQMYSICSNEIKSFVGPTVQESTVVLGRENLVYPKGPYKSCKEYFESYIIKELIFHNDSSEKVKKIKEISVPNMDDKFCLHHGDLEGRNILYHEGSISSILDWSFAGFYPKSLFFERGLDFLDEDMKSILLEEYMSEVNCSVIEYHNKINIGLLMMDNVRDDLNTQIEIPPK